MGRLRLLSGTTLVGHEDGVDDVDDAVGLEDIGCGDGGHAALGVGEHDLAAGHGCGEVFALDGLESGFAAALFNHSRELPGADSAGYYVVGEDFVEGFFIFWLDEGVDGAGRELGESIVGWSEDGEWAGAVECVDEASRFDGCDEGLVDRRVDGVLDDGFGGVHGGPTDGWVGLGVSGYRGDGESGCRQGGEKCLLHCGCPFRS